MANSPTITLIAAMDRQRVIGAGARIPWRLRTDQRRFKELTMGKPLIMGRKTFEAIGRPLPGRHNIVMTRREGYAPAGVTIVPSIEAALDAAGDVDEIMIGGGGVIYELFLPQADRLLLTYVDAAVEGDIVFPAIEPDRWCEQSREEYDADQDNEYDFVLVEYRRCE